MINFVKEKKIVVRACHPLVLGILVVEGTMVLNKVLNPVGWDCPRFSLEWDAPPSCPVSSQHLRQGMSKAFQLGCWDIDGMALSWHMEWYPVPMSHGTLDLIGKLYMNALLLMLIAKNAPYQHHMVLVGFWCVSKLILRRSKLIFDEGSLFLNGLSRHGF